MDDFESVACQWHLSESLAAPAACWDTRNCFQGTAAASTRLGAMSGPGRSENGAAFVPYPKIPTRLGVVPRRVMNKGAWVVTEKVHGANLCCLIDEAGAITYCKRKEVLSPNDPFFGYKNAIPPRYAASLRRTSELIRTSDARCTSDSTVHVYCELFGGAYPHQGVVAAPAVDPVQSGVFYSPKLELYAFDLAFTTDGLITYVDYLEACRVFASADLFHAEPLFVGSFQEALGYSERFQSTIPARLGYPPLEENLAEGVVLKPVVACFEDASGIAGGTGNGGRSAARVIVKKKIREFSEKRYDDVQRQPRAEAEAEAGGPQAWVDRAILLELLALVTRARLENVLSKIGHIDVGDKQQMRSLLADFIADVWEEVDLDAEQRQRLPCIQASLDTEVEAAAKEVATHYFRDRRRAARAAGRETKQQRGTIGK